MQVFGRQFSDKSAQQTGKHEAWIQIPKSNCKSQVYQMCSYISNIEDQDRQTLGLHATDPIANGELRANEEALI